MVHIPVAQTFTATRVGQGLNDVACERCGVAYVYLVTRKATGEGTSILFIDQDGAKAAAADRAAQALGDALATAVDPVACPSCGHYQANMVLVARQRRGKWWLRFAIGAAAFAAFVVFIACLFRVGEPGPFFTPELRPFAATSGGLVLVALALLAVRRLRCTNWDPNRDTLWKRRNQKREAGVAMLRADFERMAAEGNSLVPGS